MRRRIPQGATTADRLAFHSTAGPNGCVLWTANTIPDGYGRLVIDRKSLLAHRVAWELANDRPVPPGMCVCHRCDVPACINPDHLFLGTHADNMADMALKKRQPRIPRGERHKASKLTDAIVRLIRADGRSQQAIADEYGVSQSNISRVLLGHTWRHVP